MTRQAIIFIHGIGEQQPGYSAKSGKKIDNRLRKFLRQEVSQPLRPPVIYKEVWWANHTSKEQRKLLNKVNRTHDLDWTLAREFMVAFVGDAIAYQKTRSGDLVYKAIHQSLQTVIDSVTNEFPEDHIEFTFVAHSLGSVIASNYLYDRRNHFTATNFFTLGSPIAIWILRHGDIANANQPIQVTRPNGVWINILDDDDVIGYPLRDVNKHYRQAVDMDYVTEIGGLLQWTPLSHVDYWTDGNVVKPIAYKLMLDFLRIQKKKTYSKTAYLNFIEGLWNI